MPETFDVIIVGMQLRWNGVWQRPNHILSRLAARVPVIVLEEPLIADDERDVVVQAQAGVTVITPHRRAPNDVVDEQALRTVREAAGTRTPLVWLYTPRMVALADAFRGARLVYDKMDELARFKDADPRIGTREVNVLERASIVFAGGRTLYASVRGRTGRSRCYPSGVEVEHFRQAVPLREERRRAGGDQRPRLIYVGVIDERIDLALIDRVAASHPDWLVTMVGPTAKIDPATLPVRDNIAYLGSQPYAALPALLASADVGLMPFAMNEATTSISPTKTLEYFAAGLPVVSTPVPDVVADYDDVAGIAADAPGFVREIERALQPDDERIARAAQRTLAATWDAIASAMWDDVQAAVRDRDVKRSA